MPASFFCRQENSEGPANPDRAGTRMTCRYNNPFIRTAEESVAMLPSGGSRKPWAIGEEIGSRCYGNRGLCGQWFQPWEQHVFDVALTMNIQRRETVRR